MRQAFGVAPSSIGAAPVKPRRVRPVEAVSNASVVVRDVAIDRFRGGLIVLMVAGNYAAGVAWVPGYLKHATGNGFTIADVVAPAFVFAIGLTYGASFRRRARRGVAGAYRHFVSRYLALTGVGAILSLVSTNFMHAPRYWGVLQALGAAGLVALLVIGLAPGWRFVIGLGVIAGYQIGLDHSTEMLHEVTRSSLGGAYGVLAWAALLVLSTAVADLVRRGSRWFLVTCGGLWVLAAASLPLAGASRAQISISFVLVCLAISATTYFAVDVVARRTHWAAASFAWCGSNALLLYLAHEAFLGVFRLPSAPWWYARASVPLSFAELGVMLALLSALAGAVSRRGMHLSL